MSKFGELPSNNLGVFAVKTRNFCRYLPTIWRLSLFVTLAFPNGLEDSNFDFSRAIGNHFCTPCRNLVRFGEWPQSLRQKKLYSQRRGEWPLLFASAFNNELADYRCAFNRFNGNNHATSCRNWVNFRPTISVFCC